MNTSLIDGLSPRAKPPVGFLKAPIKLMAEFKRQGGKGQFAQVEADVSPARTLLIASTENAWSTRQEQSEYEPHLVQGILTELMSVDGTAFLGLKVEVVAAKTDEVSSSPMAFFQVGRLLVLKLLASETADGQRCWEEGQ